MPLIPDLNAGAVISLLGPHRAVHWLWLFRSPFDPVKMNRLKQWCEDVNRAQSDVTFDFVYVDQESFEEYRPRSFRELVDGFREYKG